MDRELTALKEIGNAHLLARRFDAASSAYEEAAHLSELPRGGLCVKLARAHLAAGRPEAAAPWLMQVVDPAASFRTWAAAAGLLSRCPVETWPGVRRHLTVGLVGTWTTSTFAPLLRLAAARLGIALTIQQPDFGQYFNATLDPDSALLAANPDVLILAPDHRALGVRSFSDTPEADADGRGGALVGRLVGGAPSGGAGDPADGLRGARQRPARASRPRPRRHAAERHRPHQPRPRPPGRLPRTWASSTWRCSPSRMGTDDWFDDRGWYMAKMPFAPDSLPVMARHTAAVLAARLGLSRRAIVLDLDNTLWGGVIGDDGIDGIVLGGGTAGEAFQDFQVALKELVNRGIVLAVCSKNDREVALAPFREHPEMVLKEEDIAAFVANWEPKSRNIQGIADTLGLGLDSFTFLDDNPYERAEVRRALPEVDVPILPDDPTGYRRALEEYPYFEPSAFTARRPGPRRAVPGARPGGGAAGERGVARGLPGEPEHDRRGWAASTRRASPAWCSSSTRPTSSTSPPGGATRPSSRPSSPASGAHRPAGAPRRPLRRPWAHRRGAGRGPRGTEAAAQLEIDTLLMSCRVLGRGVEAVVLAELARLAAEAGCIGGDRAATSPPSAMAWWPISTRGTAS